MIKLNKKSGFSLAESVISLMLLTLVIILTMSSITRKKHHPTVKSQIGGMYACWKSNGKIHTRQYDGNRLVESDNKDAGESTCEFTMDRRVSAYYIYVVGSRKCNGDCVNGQVKQYSYKTPNGTNENNMILKITLGKNEDYNKTAGITKVKASGSSDKTMIALGGLIKNDSKLVPANIKSCKFISGDVCPDGYNEICIPSNQNGNIEVNVQNDVNIATIQCEKDNTTLTGGYISLNEITEVDNDIYKVELTKNDGSKIENVKIAIQEYDPSLKAKNQDLEDSEFVKQLKMLPQSRQNGLTDELLKYYQNKSSGTTEKDGVVLIIW